MFGWSAMNFCTLRLNVATSAGWSGFGLFPTVIVTGAFSSIAPPLFVAGVEPFAQAAAVSSAAAVVSAATHLAVLVI
jgi:hypothetical protein